MIVSDQKVELSDVVCSRLTLFTVPLEIMNQIIETVEKQYLKRCVGIQF